MSLPLFRTPLPQTRAIRWPECLAGYAVILIVMPLVGLALNTLGVLLLKGSGITRSAIGPAAQHAEQMVEALMYSFIMSWIGCLVSLPFVIAARWYGAFGFGTAIVTSLVVLFLVMAFPDYIRGLRGLWDMMGLLGLPSAVLGVSFWLTVRLLRPAAFI